MKTIKPTRGNRIGVALHLKDGSEGNSMLTATVTSVKVDNSSPFWSIYFGRTYPDENGVVQSDKGIVVLDEDLIREVIETIVKEGKNA